MKKLPNDNTAKQEIKTAFIICGQPIISVFQQHIAYSSGQTMLQEHSLQTAFINYRFQQGFVWDQPLHLSLFKYSLSYRTCCLAYLILNCIRQVWELCGGNEVLQRCFANLFSPHLFLVLLNCILQIYGRNENRANIQVPAQGGWLSLLRQCKQLGEAVPSCTRWSIGGTTPQDVGQPHSELGSGSEGSECAFMKSFLSLCRPHFSSRRVSLENPTSCKSGGFHLSSFADQIILHSLCSDT